MTYADLEHEAQMLFDRAAERIDEKDDENDGPAWRDCHPEYLAECADSHRPLGEVVEDGDADEVRKEAADQLNYLLMTLSQMPAGNRGERDV